jgi:hypothetical protein
LFCLNTKQELRLYGTTLRVVDVVYSCSASSSKRQSMHKQSLACAFWSQYLHSIILIIKAHNGFDEKVKSNKQNACA